MADVVNRPGIPHRLDRDSGALVIDATDIVLDDSGDRAFLSLVAPVITGGGSIAGTGQFNLGATHTFRVATDAASILTIDANNSGRVTFGWGDNNQLAFEIIPNGNTSKFVFYDHSGAKIFEIDNNGDLHGKTGKALTFDL